MKNVKYIVIGILLLSTTILAAANTRAQDYSMGIQADAEMEISITTVDREKLVEVFGFENEGNSSERYKPPFWSSFYVEGLKIVKYKITSIDKANVSNTDNFVITTNHWGLAGLEGFYEKPDSVGDAKELEDPSDDEGAIGYIPQDPSDWGDNVTWNTPSSLTDLLIPVNVEEYLDNIDWKENYTSEENSVIWDGVLGQDKDDENVDGYKKWNYGDNGVLQTYQILTSDEEVLIEFGVQGGFIPGYSLPLFLTFAAISSIGIVYIIMKKRK
ncbi:MAG: hypothetical protein ACOC35_14995 [Promethearchaeia archaeon]